MKETDWVEKILQPSIQKILSAMGDESLQVLGGKKLPYSNCITRYDRNGKPLEIETQSYEADLLIVELHSDLSWSPRVIIETKLETITTHDAITYGHKAYGHRTVHPYLRYGILLGAFTSPLPASLIVHGGNFDFVMSWKKTSPDARETEQIINIIRSEIEASRQLHDLIKTKRTKDTKSVFSIQKKLELKGTPAKPKE